MEKSIETLWKEGFINSDALIAPKVNDIYQKKSIHLIEKFQRMFRVNIWGIVAAAVILLLVSVFVGAILAGSILLISLLFVAFTANKDLKALEQLDKGETSYAFLSAFRDWIEGSIERYGKIYRIIYPVLILTFYLGAWFSDLLSPIREQVAEKSDILFYGLHIPTTLMIMGLAILMSIFSKAIHRRDVGLIYGGILTRLEESLAEMEELRGE